jgi:hypothetical protein
VIKAGFYRQAHNWENPNSKLFLRRTNTQILVAVHKNLFRFSSHVRQRK